MKPCLRPQRKQRRTIRVENFGFFCALTTTEVLAINYNNAFNNRFLVKKQRAIALLEFL